MGDTKYSALPAVTTLASADLWAVDQSGASKSLTASVLRQYVGAGLSNASLTTVAGGYSTDTYLAGSAITIPAAGGWRVGTLYVCTFDMTKTAAGTAAFTVNVRMGTTGTVVGDTNINFGAFGAGTAAADTGMFTVRVAFRSVGGATAAVIQYTMECRHHLAATGLISTGASGIGILNNTSSGFNSTTQTIIGLSINGGASFSGTNTMVDAYALNI